MGSNSRRLLGVAAVAAAAVLGVSGCGSSAAAGDDTAAGDPQTLVLAAIPAEDSESLQQQYKLVAEVIEKETGHKVEFQNATDYSAVIEGQRAGKVQIAGYGPFSYITAKDSGVGTIPVAAPVKSASAKPGYQSYAITKGGSNIKSLSDFRGKTVCFVDPASTSGYLYPSAGLKELGIDPEKDVTPVFAGGHDASVLAVNSGQCDAGFAYDTIVDKVLVEKGQIKPGDIDVVWKSETIAASPIAISTDLSPELQAQLTAIFREQLNRPALVQAGVCADEDSCDLPEDVGYGYVPVEDSLYDGVRKVCEVTQAAACKN
ncbi:phosphate/phosphite/phosphonate ABC transporter substrate-binding protein [Rhodococcus sp. ABRD24]|uniref:phosphate/phosphite/phosphonate ABC transporter substrate-binding protein n=1 Tax=Rhodococcus sp. ABRD24 TaxID=2507582 RepID=UPI00103D12C1|nr:phosphate/phosphite/phosphonate ABC transporter substrate-binding protein [Rhodococcus sp. ABRD24]QBJ96447.1 phosphate/phosphite/phosphonate ABC transporter substrate-binding protein [Rhodococcus sp. ABRD24]